MKKLVFIFLFWTSFLPLIAQVNYVTVQGYVTDSANGAPIANYPVTIQMDSTSGFYYYNVVYTMSSGLYVDTIVFNTSIPSGNVLVSVYDCHQDLVMATLPFGTGNQALSHNFQICYSTTPCIADYSWQVVGNLAVQFTDQSTGTPTAWSWQFGDGGTSSQQNPSHTYTNTGTYIVELSIYDTATNCSSSKTKYVVVGDSTGGCIAMFYTVADTGNPLNIYFYNQSSGNNITSWFWDFGDGNSTWITFPANPNVTHIYADSGT